MTWGQNLNSPKGPDSGPIKLVVGIGASAGGLEAFLTFFAHLPRDTGMAFVLVQHLSPSHDSMLTEILAKAATIPVVEATDDMPLVANRAHVIPQDATLTIKDGRLRVSKPAPPRSDRRPIDSFFASLAEDQAENAVCIVLSGVGSDGAAGLAQVKEHGGLTIAQGDFEDRAMSGMPQSAAATGLVDYVLRVEDIPARLIAYRDHLDHVADRKDGEGTRTDAAQHLASVMNVLRAKTGHDFSKYKAKTVTRRIQRRMQVLQAETVPDYIKLLQEKATEPELLFQDLLIGVTEFFRDPEAFQGLAAAIEAMVEKGGEDPSLRVWTPACSTGEEVYSLAIMIRELLDARGSKIAVQIFGSDIDGRAIEAARTGRFERILGLSPERLKKWFYKSDGGFYPVREIRSMCVFSVHNVAKDPPFSKLDLVTCRNLLIYMDADLQDRVLRTFHYALRPGGLLFLGLSEGVSGHDSLFLVQDKAARIFRRREGVASVPQLPATESTQAKAEHASAPPGRNAGDRVERAVRAALAQHAPVFIVVDQEFNIVRYSGGDAALFLEPTAGAASLSLLQNLKRSLRVVVRTALQSVVKTGQGVVVDNVAMRLEGRQRLLSVIVEPVPDEGREGLFVVAFHNLRTASPETPGGADTGEPNPEARAAEQELRSTRAQLQTSISSLETANEEMKSAAEEYQSVNEELQSTNEELQTSKEEMQSINEELQTVNAEMMAKNELLSNLNSDLQNLLDSTQIATIFLDESLRIRNFTPGMADIFSLRDGDRGRPLTEIVSLVAYDGLMRDVTKVLRELTVVEREVNLLDRAATFIMRVRPYRSIDRVIEGVVITFIDVTERKRAEHAQDVSERRFSAIVNQASVGITETDLNGGFQLTNAAFEAMAARSGPELCQLTRRELIAPDDVKAISARFDQAARDGEAFEAEYRILRRDGTTIWVHDSVSILEGEDGKPARVISVTLEIDKRKGAEEHARLLLGELDHRVKNILAIVSSIVAQTLKSNPSPKDFAESINGRIAAIARAHGLLTDRGAGRAGTLRELIQTELEPYRGRDLVIDGPDVVLTPKAGLSIAMSIHELASNAAKYGSLSESKGCLAVTWEVSAGPDPRLRLHWVESDGPRVPGPPAKRVFGTSLIERSMAYEWDALVVRTFAESGVKCTIDLPFTADVGELRMLVEVVK